MHSSKAILSLLFLAGTGLAEYDAGVKIVTEHAVVWKTVTRDQNGNVVDGPAEPTTSAPAAPATTPAQTSAALEGLGLHEKIQSDTGASSETAETSVPSYTPAPSPTETSSPEASGLLDGLTSYEVSLPPIATSTPSGDDGITSYVGGQGCAAVTPIGGTDGPITVTMINSYGSDLMMSFCDSDGKAGVAGATDTTAPLPAATTYVATMDYPWSGRIVVGEGTNSAGTKFEGAVGMDPAWPYPAWDVSYVDGYTVPMVCSEETLDNPPIRGCNIELWDEGNTCSLENSDDGKICINDAKDKDAAGWLNPEAFFMPCRKSAYVFPKDDCGSVGNAANKVVCCIGTKCPKAATQSNASASKRSVLEEAAAQHENEKREAAIARRSKHLHRHAAAHAHQKI